MDCRRFLFVSGVLFWFFDILLSHTLFAQGIWLNDRKDNEIVIEYLKPSFKLPSSSFYDSESKSCYVITLSGRFRIGENNFCILEIPYSYGKLDYSYYFDWGRYSDFYSGSYSGNTIGNIYIGLELHLTGTPIYVDVGIRPPTASISETSSEPALEYGILTDVDRYEAMVRDLIAFNAIVNYAPRLETAGAMLRLRIGPTIWVPTKGYHDIECLLAYSLQGGYEGDAFSLTGGFSGRMILTEEGDLSKRTFHQLGLNLSFRFGSLRPGVLIRFPFDDNLKESIDNVLGLNLAVEL